MEKELLTLKSAGKILHPKTIRALALYEALAEDVPSYSVLYGYATLATLLIDDLTQRGLAVPPQLGRASKELVAMQADIAAQWQAQSYR